MAETEQGIHVLAHLGDIMVVPPAELIVEHDGVIGKLVDHHAVGTNLLELLHDTLLEFEFPGVDEPAAHLLIAGPGG